MGYVYVRYQITKMNNYSTTIDKLMEQDEDS